MKDNDANNPQTKNNEPNITANAQYVKDLSFENPNSPSSLANLKSAPQIEVNVDVQVTKLDGDIYEVNLITTAKANSEGENLFIIELSYAGVFTVTLSEKDRNYGLMIYCPSLLFPFARSIISNITRDGGFPPLMLEPIDFAALYENHQKDLENQSKESAETH